MSPRPREPRQKHPTVDTAVLLLSKLATNSMRL